MKKSFNLKLKNMLQALIIVDMTSSIIVTFLIYDEREKQAMFPILDPTLYIGSLATKEQELVAYLTNKGLKKDSDYTLKVNANHAIITPTEKYKNKTTVIIALIKKLDLNTLPTNITLEGPFTEIGVFKKAIFETLKKTTNFTNLTLTNINITKADNTELNNNDINKTIPFDLNIVISPLNDEKQYQNRKKITATTTIDIATIITKHDLKIINALNSTPNIEELLTAIKNHNNPSTKTLTKTDIEFINSSITTTTATIKGVKKYYGTIALAYNIATKNPKSENDNKIILPNNLKVLPEKALSAKSSNNDLTPKTLTKTNTKFNESNTIATTAKIDITKKITAENKVIYFATIPSDENAKKAKVKSLLNEKGLIADTDYTLEVNANTVKVSGINNYKNEIIILLKAQIALNTVLSDDKKIVNIAIMPENENDKINIITKHLNNMNLNSQDFIIKKTNTNNEFQISGKNCYFGTVTITLKANLKRFATTGIPVEHEIKSIVTVKNYTYIATNNGLYYKNNASLNSMFQLFENSKDISFLQNLYFTNFNDEYILYAVGNQLQLKEKNNYQYLGTYLYTIRANTNSSALKLLAPDVTNNYMASSWTFNTYTNSELYIGFYNGDLYEKKIASGNISKIATLNTQINNIVILKDQEKLLITTNTTNYTVSILENSINNYKNNYKVFYYYDLISYSYYIYELDNLNSKIYIWNNNILVTTINLPKDKIYTNISIKNNGDIYVLSTTSTLIFKRIGTVIYQYNDRFSEWVIALKNIDNSNNFYVITNDNKIFYYE